jgi:YjbR
LSKDAEVPSELLAGLRSACLALPEAYEEQAWVGTRWCVRKQTFAHVLQLEDGWPPVYARAVGTDGPVTVLTFQSSGEELEALGKIGHPFFRPVWRPGIVAMLLGRDPDWDEIEELVVDSYCLLAPKKLVDLVDTRVRGEARHEISGATGDFVTCLGDGLRDDVDQ